MEKRVEILKAVTTAAWWVDYSVGLKVAAMVGSSGLHWVPL